MSFVRGCVEAGTWLKYFACALSLVPWVVEASDWEVSGQLRERITHSSAVEFNSDSGEAGTFWTQRLSLEGQYTFDQNWSFTGGLLSAFQEGVDISPVERNNLDYHLAYVRYKNADWQVNVGRQTLKLGSQRLIAWRDGTNVRRAWQGVRATWQTQPHWRSDWFAFELIGVDPNGAFNDDAEHENRLAGSYHTLDLTGLGWSNFASAGLDLYYLYTNRDDRGSIEGRANQVRHTVGFRYFVEDGQWYWDWEGAYQLGHHGDNDIRAWTFASNTGYQLDWRYRPEIMLSLNVASGDDENGDGELGTFDALFPRGSYFSEAAILGPANFYNAHTYFIFNPQENLRLFFDINMYWRLEKNDGVYGPPGNLIRRPGQSDASEVNLAYSVGIEWQINDRLDTSLLTTYSRPREFLRESGATDDTYFVEYTLNWRLF